MGWERGQLRKGKEWKRKMKTMSLEEKQEEGEWTEKKKRFKREITNRGKEEGL